MHSETSSVLIIGQVGVSLYVVSVFKGNICAENTDVAAEEFGDLRVFTNFVVETSQISPLHLVLSPYSSHPFWRHLLLWYSGHPFVCGHD